MRDFLLATPTHTRTHKGLTQSYAQLFLQVINTHLKTGHLMFATVEAGDSAVATDVADPVLHMVSTD
jgi:hypothetical protein